MENEVKAVQQNTNTGSGSAGKGSGLARVPSVLWRVLVSPVTFVVLTILWCLDLAGGSIAAYYNDPQFWVKMDSYPFNLWMKQVAPRIFPQSLWIYILVVLSYLMILSLVLCTINWFFRRRRKLRGIGEVLVHLGFLMIFAGFAIGSAFGVRVQVDIREGQTVEVPEMGISLRLDDLQVLQSPEGRPLDTLSSVRVMADGRTVSRGRIRTNHPLIRGSTVIYPPDDYNAGVGGGVLGTRGAGAVTLVPGRDVDVGGGRYLSLGGILQPGQRRGNALGPGLLVLVKEGGGRVLDSAYLSPVPGMRGEAVIAGVAVTLGQLIEGSFGIYRVHHDPGVWLVIIGTVILALGTLWALAGYLGILPATMRMEPSWE